MMGIIWGTGLCLAGIAMLGKYTGLFNIMFNGWWTLFLIVPAVIDLFTKRDKTFSLILLSVGTVLLLQQLKVLENDLAWRIFFACVIIIIGLSIVFSGIKKKNMPWINVETKVTAVKDEGSNNYSAIFGEQKRVYKKGEKFSSAIIEATFGGVILDLREADIEEGAMIEAKSVFGGCEIFVPIGTNVQIYGNSIFGGVDDKTMHSSINEQKTISIKTDAVFGGIAIKN